MALRLVTPPDDEPLTVDEAKEHLRIVDTDEAQDNYIDALIGAARNMAEAYTGRAFITQTWDYTLDELPTSYFDIPKPPLQSIYSLDYVDSSGVTTALYSSLSSPQIGIADFVIDRYAEPARLLRAYGYYWPSVIYQPNGVTLRFVAGYGLDGSAVPAAIRQAMLLLIGHWFEHRESVSDVRDMRETPQGAMWLLQPYRVLSVV